MRYAHVRNGYAPTIADRPVHDWCRCRRRSRFLRVAAGGIGAALILWPHWAASRDDFFLFSILPSLRVWLGLASGLAGLGLPALAVTPARARVR
ncbi:hypothetical protein [Roseivivax lentus]|uniref:hypothetical protein n=1 Tax=Roseivivax lentus TaxID=633194 RepID=UPI000970BCDC|nr:hypothetical protein [Roseivivax lentus]